MEISNGLSIKHELHIFATIQGPLQFVSDSGGESTHLHIPSSGLAMMIKTYNTLAVSRQSLNRKVKGGHHQVLVIAMCILDERSISAVRIRV